MRRIGPRGAVLPSLLALWAMLAPATARAYEINDDLEIRGTYRGESYIRLPQGTEKTFWSLQNQRFQTEDNDVLMSMRHELRLDVEMTLHTELLWEWLGRSRATIQLRPWWDMAYDLTTQGAAGHTQQLCPFWCNNGGAIPKLDGDASVATRDAADPLFREYYLDLTPDHFFFRIGRQIIPWGKSDGVYMLDVINPFNLRNPTIFEEENFKVPVWAANLNYQPTPTSNLQLLYIPHYLHNWWGGINVRRSDGASIESRFHDWTYQIVGFFNDFYNGEFGFRVPVKYNLPANTIGNSITGLRWSDSFARVNYTLNYLYTFTPNLIDYPNAGSFLSPKLTQVIRQPGIDRMHVIGGSADYDINMGNDWLDGIVMRAETSFTLNDVYYKGTVGNPVATDHWGVLAGLDKTILSNYLERPVFASLQYWHDLVIHTPQNCNQCGPFAGRFQDLGYNGGLQGLRKAYKSLMTLYLSKNWLAGDTLITEFFTLYEFQFGDFWVRPKVTWKINDYTTAAVGANIFAGGNQTPYGQWKDNTNLFFELRRALF